MDHLEQQQLGLQCTSLYTSKGALCRLVTSHDGVILPVLPHPTPPQLDQGTIFELCIL